MILHRPGSARRRGSALVLALVVVSAVAILSLGWLRMAALATSGESQRGDRSASFYLAEAGLAEAYTGLAVGRTGQVGSPEDPARLGDGLFWVDAEDLGDGRLALASTGMAGGSKATLSIVVEPGMQSLASLGVFSLAPLVVPPGTLIDGYDSRLGTYEQQASPDPSAEQVGRLGSNEGAYVTGTPELPTFVLGDLTPGPLSTVNVGGNATVSGSTEPAVSGVSLPGVVLPGVAQLPGLELEGPAPALLLPGKLGLEYVHLSDGAELTIQGPATILVGNLQVLESSSLRFDTRRGAIDLYVVDHLTLEAGSTVSTSSDDTSQVTIQVANQGQVDLHATGAFHGMLYAPLSSASLAAEFELFGALVAESLQLSVGGRLHFDRALAAQIDEQEGLPELLSWRILELGVSDPGSASEDPFRIAGVDPALLPKPALAHADQWLAVEYVDTGGQQQSYEGWESAFDWTGVQSVLALMRDGLVVAKGVDDGSGIDPGDASLLALLDQGLPPGELKNELLAASPLSDTVLTAVVNKQVLPPGDLRLVMVANSPLAPDVLQAVIDLSPPLPAALLAQILAAQ